MICLERLGCHIEAFDAIRGATVQTTSIDETAGIVRLSTVLAHASGEWIASDWPVCAISETSAPHRMGAALTYARRYALFTLVGIAGEDDLDAPDLVAPTPTSKEDRATSNKKGHLNGGRDRQFSGGRPRKVASPSLEPEASSVLRDQLITELESISSADEAANWAHRALGKKNILVEGDAIRVEQAFQARLAVVSDKSLNENSSPQEPKSPQPQQGKPRQSIIDKSVLALPAPRRIRDREHVKMVAKLPCLVCGRIPADAHHLRFAQSPALGRKVSDEFTVPLCRGHHRDVHHCGDEAAWWERIGIDPNSHRSRRMATNPSTSASCQLAGCPPCAKVKTANRNQFGESVPMTKFRQIEANRRNALKSTGPKTEAGKEQSRCNAVRHGLTAETVIVQLEDAEDYRQFEASVIADYDAQSAVERELVLRLASILWRLRRATTMETGLFEIQAEHLREYRQNRQLLLDSGGGLHALSQPELRRCACVGAH